VREDVIVENLTGMNVDKMFDRFTLKDFLAYFFPGVVEVLGLYLLLRLMPIGEKIPDVNIDFLEGVILFIVAYVTGVVLSSFSWGISSLIKRVARKYFELRKNQFKKKIKKVEEMKKKGGEKKPVDLEKKEKRLERKKENIEKKVDDLEDARGQISPAEFQVEVIRVFNEILGPYKVSATTWSSKHFFLVRSLIDQWMPEHSTLAKRQNTLRMFRQYMLSPVFIWVFFGVAWGAGYMTTSPWWGFIGILGSIIVGGRIAYLLVVRAIRNERREVREICLALLVGHQTGVFGVREDSNQLNKDQA